MIVSDLRNWKQEMHAHSAVFSQAIDWIEREISLDSQPGKYPIDGDLMFVLVQHLTTEPSSQRLAEAHREYIDMQLLLSGRELIRVAREGEHQLIVSDELESRDVLRYKTVAEESDLVLTPGMFTVFFPSDIHRPCCSVDGNIEIRKAVVKIHRSLL